MNRNLAIWFQQYILVIVIFLSILITIVLVSYNIYIRNTSGVIKIKSPSSIEYYITSPNRISKYIGAGNTFVRVSPGVYQITGISSGNCRVYNTIKIIKKETKTVNINISSTNKTILGSDIVKKIPFTSTESSPYTIDINKQDPLDNCISNIVIKNATPLGREAALQWIREQGYDPGYLNITFNDFSNPTSEDN